VPASAVIPAPIVYTNIAAVKKLVVREGPWLRTRARAVVGRGWSGGGKAPGEV